MNKVILLSSFIIIQQLYSFPALPMKTYYYSPNKIYRLLIIPSKYEENTNDFYLGKLSKLGRDNIYQPVYSFHLDNHPRAAIVSDDGSSFATFTYYWGDPGVVIYGPEGKTIKKYSLEDILSDQDMKLLEKVINEEMIDWGYGHFVDDETKTLVLGISPNASSNNFSFIHTLRIDIKTGNIIKYDTGHIKTVALSSKELLFKPEPIYLPNIIFPKSPGLTYYKKKHIYNIYGRPWIRFNVKVELLINFDGTVSSVRILNPELYKSSYNYIDCIVRESLKAKFSSPRDSDGEICQVIIKGVYKVIPNKPSVLEIQY